MCAREVEETETHALLRRERETEREREREREIKYTLIYIYTCACVCVEECAWRSYTTAERESERARDWRERLRKRLGRCVVCDNEIVKRGVDKTEDRSASSIGLS